MPRYRLDIAYDGAPFAGWQRQADARSVQQALEEAIERFAGTTQSGIMRLHAAGRTDAGVHATGQVAHVDLTREWEARTVRRAVNSELLRADLPVAIRACARVGEDFHARFSATARHYRYAILDRDWPPTLERGEVWWVPRRDPLDLDAMRLGAERLLGRHDFTTFRAAQCQADSPVRTMDEVAVTRVGDEVRLRLAARSFLHNQVRSIAGTLERVGAGRWAPDDVRDALAARDRSACGPVAPARGLYFVSARYADGST